MLVYNSRKKASNDKEKMHYAGAMDSLFAQVKTLSFFWEKHLYCLPNSCIERGIRFLSTCSYYLREKYSQYQLTKILNAFCVFEKIIQEAHRAIPQKRMILFRLFKMNIMESSTLGIAIVLKLKTTESMSNDHLLRAILNILPGVVAIRHAHYHFHDSLSGFLFIYQEIEKKRGRGFLSFDIQQLKRLLKKELEENIRVLTPPIFFMRNEEEIFRNVVQMGKELEQPKDLPLVTISFQEQTSIGSLRFSVVVIRIVSAESIPLKDLSASLPQTIKTIVDMVSTIGKIDGKYAKEANIMTFEVESFCFARKNGSIDLREARSYIVKALELMIGEYRDYNGALLSTQNKHLNKIQDLFEEECKFSLRLLFYSFSPQLFQSFILPEAFRTCAALFLEAQQCQLPSKKYIFLRRNEQNFSVLIIKTANEHLKIIKEITNFPSLPLHQFGYTVQNIDGDFYIGLIYQYASDLSLFDTIEYLLQETCPPPSKQESRFLRINFQDGDPPSLNPQIGLDLSCRSLQKALFEGLTRIGANGVPQLAAAEGVEILDEGKTYFFTLRKLQWSNGEELSAYQFEKTWKRAIKSPACLRPDMFFILKNARKARQGEVNIEEVGVNSLDKYTLKVSLEYPTSRFLEMLAHPLFFPLYETSGEPSVFNGPFTLRSWIRDQSILLIKNPYYWDFENVKLNGIEISIVRDPFLALRMYEDGELDWIGGPFSPLPLATAQGMSDKLQKVDTSAVAWLYCNLSRPLFSSPTIRRTLSYALDRKKICENALLNPIPLKTLLPKDLSLLSENDLYQEEQVDAHLFNKSCAEMRSSLKNLDSLTLLNSQISGQRELAIEVQNQWQEKFGFKIERIEKSWNSFSRRLDNRLFYFGTCYRHPFYYDPMYFFQIFHDPNNIHNAFGWHSEHFNSYIHSACACPENKSYLKLAEIELTRQMPVIPIHMVTYHYLARGEVKGIYFCHSGDIDFKWISFEET
jgi:oligopeptide transport system substrate-binding protein